MNDYFVYILKVEGIFIVRENDLAYLKNQQFVQDFYNNFYIAKGIKIITTMKGTIHHSKKNYLDVS